MAGRLLSTVASGRRAANEWEPRREEGRDPLQSLKALKGA